MGRTFPPAPARPSPPTRSPEPRRGGGTLLPSPAGSSRRRTRNSPSGSRTPTSRPMPRSSKLSKALGELTGVVDMYTRYKEANRSSTKRSRW